MQFSKEMIAWLKHEASRQDTSVAAVVREAISLLMEKSKQ